MTTFNTSPPIFENLNEARDHYYPDAWMFGQEGQQPRESACQPHYTVIYENEEERKLAYAVRPSFVVARIISLEEANAELAIS
jgi:hypothetical protein